MIILIIILNLHDQSLNWFAYNARLKSFGSGSTPDPKTLDVGMVVKSCHESMITK